MHLVNSKSSDHEKVAVWGYQKIAPEANELDLFTQWIDSFTISKPNYPGGIFFP